MFGGLGFPDSLPIVENSENVNLNGVKELLLEEDHPNRVVSFPL